MPQLDPSSFSSQLFWLTLSFVALYFLLARSLLPRVQSTLAQRAWTMESDVKQAEHLKSEAERARDQYEKALADARAQSQAMFAKTLAEMTARATAKQAELDAMIEKKLAESDASIRAARQEVMGKLTPVCSELASLIVEALVHHKPSPQEVGSVISGLAKERAV